jgi:putative membrane protein
MANERTFLAWMRTSLALVAGGVALEAFGLPLQPTLRLTASILLLVLGLVAVVHGWWGWARAERAMRRGDPLPSLGPAVVVAAGVAVVVVLVAVAILVR